MFSVHAGLTAAKNTDTYTHTEGNSMQIPRSAHRVKMQKTDLGLLGWRFSVQHVVTRKD